MILHLGVVDIAYSQAPKANRRHRKQPKAGTETTGEVAEWLERKYHVMDIYADRHLQEIADSLADSMAGALEGVLMGAPARNPFASAESAIEHGFRQFLDSREIESVEGPTKAAVMGVNHRLASGRGPRRPSFIDTGLYEASMRAWVE